MDLAVVPVVVRTPSVLDQLRPRPSPTVIAEAQAPCGSALSGATACSWSVEVVRTTHRWSVTNCVAAGTAGVGRRSARVSGAVRVEPQQGRRNDQHDYDGVHDKFQKAAHGCPRKCPVVAHETPDPFVAGLRRHVASLFVGPARSGAPPDTASRRCAFLCDLKREPGGVHHSRWRDGLAPALAWWTPADAFGPLAD